MQVRLRKPFLSPSQNRLDYDEGSNPEARQVSWTVLKSRSAGSLINYTRPYRPRGNDQARPTLLPGCSSHRPSCVFGPSGNGANLCTPYSARLVIATARRIGYCGPFRGLEIVQPQLVANLLGYARLSHMSVLLDTGAATWLLLLRSC